MKQAYYEGIGGLINISHSEISKQLNQQKLFGIDSIQTKLFNFCKVVLEDNNDLIKQFEFYNMKPSVLLYGLPNTGKTTLCYIIFNQLKEQVTNEINFYKIDIGGMLDPALGQSSRNLKLAFDELKEVTQGGSSVFLVIDELDAFSISRNRTQENDGVRRAMTTFMIELDQLSITSTSNKFLLFGTTNVSNLMDTAVVRRFSLKFSLDISMMYDDFKNYINYLNSSIKLNMKDIDIERLYDLYKKNEYTLGDLKLIYQNLLVEIINIYKLTKDIGMFQKSNYTKEEYNNIMNILLSLFNTGFSSKKHLLNTVKEF
ncbi:MAG: AAA family ATPase [Leptospiraceae bacterium]|nr:AAA family ATPase [Leptospiraceae bacterium]